MRSYPPQYPRSFNSLKPSPPHFSSLFTLFSSCFLHRRCRVSPRRPMYLPIVGSHCCVMCFACALHVRQRNLVLLPCLYIELFELVVRVIFHHCTTPPYRKINLFKHPFRGIYFERLVDAFVLVVSLIFPYPRRILISFRRPFEL